MRIGCCFLVKECGEGLVGGVVGVVCGDGVVIGVVCGVVVFGVVVG